MELNLFGWIVLGALLLDYGLGTTASALNLRALDPRLPEEFRDVYDPSTYRRSQEYVRVRTRFGLALSSASLLAVLLFWLAGGFGRLDAATRALGQGPVLTGVVFIGTLALGASLLGLPVRYYSTFVIEERFGFNRTTRRTFWTDTAKSLALAAVLGLPLLGAILVLFQRAGPLAWLSCWVIATVYSLVVAFIAPNWILPLFNRFEPLADGEIKDKIIGHARDVGFPLRALVVMDGSRRSTKSNAFFTGFGRNKRIALFDTLIRDHEPDEIVAVVAHEIGHYRKKHVLKGLLVGIANTGIVFGLLAFFLGQPGLYAAFGVSRPSVHTGLVFFGLLYTPIEIVLAFAMHAWSRRNEYEADRLAAESTGGGRDLASALRKLSAKNLANLTPHPFHVAMRHSHPPVLRRIEALRALEAQSTMPRPSVTT